MLNNDPPKLLTAGLMARHLRVPVGWLRDEADAGRGPALKAGTVYLFVPDAVERVLVKRADCAAELAETSG